MNKQFNIPSFLLFSYDFSCNHTVMKESIIYILGMLAEVTILIHQLWYLLLQPIILLHQKFVHGCQLPIHSLKPRSLFPLFFSASAKPKHRLHEIGTRCTARQSIGSLKKGRGKKETKSDTNFSLFGKLGLIHHRTK